MFHARDFKFKYGNYLVLQDGACRCTVTGMPFPLVIWTRQTDNLRRCSMLKASTNDSARSHRLENRVKLSSGGWRSISN